MVIALGPTTNFIRVLLFSNPLDHPQLISTTDWKSEDPLAQTHDQVNLVVAGDEDDRLRVLPVVPVVHDLQGHAETEMGQVDGTMLVVHTPSPGRGWNLEITHKIDRNLKHQSTVI